MQSLVTPLRLFEETNNLFIQNFLYLPEKKNSYTCTKKVRFFYFKC